MPNDVETKVEVDTNPNPNPSLNTDDLGPDDGTELYKVKKALREKLNVNFSKLPPQTQQILSKATVRQDGKTTFLDLENGHSFKVEDGSITSPKGQKIDQNDAKMMMDLAKEKGWGSVKISGSDEEKAMLWLEAKRHGLEVTGYKPPENVEQFWKAEEAKTKNTAGVNQTPQENADDTRYKQASALIEQRLKDEKDPTVRAGLEKIRDAFYNAYSDDQKQQWNGIATALLDNKDNAVKGFNAAATIVNAIDPTAKIPPIAVSEPVATNKPAPKQNNALVA
jgi:hypothetical protein